MKRKVVVVNGNPPDQKNDLGAFLDEMNKNFHPDSVDIIRYDLAKEEIKSCVGCWDCWWKTPGVCRHTDDAAKILKAIINSDLVVYASPMIMGLYSGMLKTFHDRTIPLVHPYIEIREGENHHKKRYLHYPQMGVVIENSDATPDEIENTKYIFDRIAINFHSKVRFFYSISKINPKELAHEISHI